VHVPHSILTGKLEFIAAFPCKEVLLATLVLSLLFLQLVWALIFC
jgi:hypothetical protein